MRIFTIFKSFWWIMMRRFINYAKKPLSHIWRRLLFFNIHLCAKWSLSHISLFNSTYFDYFAHFLHPFILFQTIHSSRNISFIYFILMKFFLESTWWLLCLERLLSLAHSLRNDIEILKNLFSAFIILKTLNSPQTNERKPRQIPLISVTLVLPQFPNSPILPKIPLIFVVLCFPFPRFGFLQIYFYP